MIRRLIGSAVVLIAVLILPYWLYIPVLIIALILLPFFWEGILFAFLIDVLYGSGIQAPASLVSPFAFFILIALMVLLPLRDSLRFHV